MVDDVGEKVVAGDVVVEVAGEVGREIVGEVVVVGEVVGLAAEEVVGPGEIVGMVVYEVVQPDVVVVDLTPFINVDTEVTTPSTESSMHTNRGFPRGSLTGRCLLSK